MNDELMKNLAKIALESAKEYFGKIISFDNDGMIFENTETGKTQKMSYNDLRKFLELALCE